MLFSSPALAGAAADFAGGSLPAAPGLPLQAAVQSMTTARVLDVLVILVVTAGLYLAGLGLQKLGLRALKPWVFTSVIMGVLMFTVVDPAFWQLKGVTLDQQGVTVERYSAADQHADWDEITGLQIREGRLFPYFTDDTSLELHTRDGRTLDIPRSLPHSAEIAALIQQHIPTSATPPTR